MIVIEGPDGAGKSTLCAQLLKQGVITTILPSPRLTRTPSQTLYERSKQYMMQYGEDPRVAVDRFYYSEVVYGFTLRNNIQFSASQCIQIGRYLTSHCFVVFCLPGIHNLNYKKDEIPHLMRPEIARSLHRMYEDIYKMVAACTENVFSYNWAHTADFEVLTQRIQKFQRG